MDPEVDEHPPNLLRNVVPRVLPSYAKVEAVSPVTDSFRIFGQSVIQNDIQISDCSRESIRFGKTYRRDAPSSMLTSGHRASPFPTIPTRPLAKAALMRAGICWEYGLTIPASTSGFFAIPQIVLGRMIYDLR